MSKSRPQLGRRLDRPASETETPPVKSPETETSGERQGVSPPCPPSPDPSDDEPNPPKPGRPPGAKNREYVRGERFPGMCPKCKCTDATSESRRVIELSNDPDFTHVALIRCQCKKCKQWRIDRQRCNPAE